MLRLYLLLQHYLVRFLTSGNYIEDYINPL
uniref:Uncharacterized protein n=1 Tax=Myoviridae sp. ctijX18 TaxID=2825154 RepID=A0A8S5UT14_9CAUD|nr:MAG TPA: hypothetical protein [Myoviridae sp. ctijX18]DAQ61261.1 MAG TPA: hypothetical protein [Caudoviricetes sp.]DAX86832.1 MAG TPA: hypothetical protein [Caudoviricetes sp.]